MGDEFDVVIVGMGPAGMAAATQLARLGVTTAVVDENPDPGGHIYRQPSPEFVITDPGFAGLGNKRGGRLLEDFGSHQDRLTMLNRPIFGEFLRVRVLP